MLKFWKNLTGPCGAPTYLPTYLPCDLGSAACRLPAGAGVGTVAEMVVEGVEYVIRLASRAGAT